MVWDGGTLHIGGFEEKIQQVACLFTFFLSFFYFFFLILIKVCGTTCLPQPVTGSLARQAGDEQRLPGALCRRQGKTQARQSLWHRCRSPGHGRLCSTSHRLPREAGSGPLRNRCPQQWITWKRAWPEGTTVIHFQQACLTTKQRQKRKRVTFCHQLAQILSPVTDSQMNTELLRMLAQT